MSTTLPHDYIGDQPAPSRAPRPRPGIARQAIRSLASLRFTVVLFSLSLVLVFFGTLGMMQDSIEDTMKRYFRSWVVFIDFRTITDFGRVFLGFGDKATLPGKFPFPGGYVIGWLMFVNLLAAHALRFKLTWKRSGIFLLHAGVIVLLAGEFLTGQLSVETRMQIKEGEAARHVFSLNEQELAFVDPTNPDHDVVVVIPGTLINNARPDEWLSHPELPVDVQVMERHVNTNVRDLQPGEQPIATHGYGRALAFDPQPKVKGTDTGGGINLPGIYVRLRDKAGELLGVYMLSSQLERRPLDVQAGDKTYKMAYRFKRTYKPYSVFLDKAEHKVYAGTNTPKDFASTVRVQDPETGEVGPIRIWMNHPLYYRGETFYQSQMSTDEQTGQKTTGLQVVINPAWTFPYFACGMVAAGMAFHFLLRLITFLMNWRKLNAATPAVRASVPARTVAVNGGKRGLVDRVFPYALVGLAALMLLGRWMTPSVRDSRMNLYGYGEIPVQNGGRIQPLDSVARNSLVVISGKQEVDWVDPKDKGNKKTYQAIEWLLMLWAEPDQAEKFRIFRIEHPQILSLLKLDQRPGSYRYSMAELEPNIDRLESQASTASRKPKEKQDPYDAKLIELARHVDVYRGLQIRRNPGLVPVEDPNGKWTSFADALQALAPEFMFKAEEQARKQLAEELHKDRGLIADLVQRHFGDIDIVAYAKQTGRDPEEMLGEVIRAEARKRALTLARDQVFAALPRTYPPLGCLERMQAAYRDNDPVMFNAAVAEYHEKYTGAISAEDKSKVSLEARMNFFDPFLQCAVLYLVVLVLVVLFWVLRWDPLRQGAFQLALLTLAVHTAALVFRMYIGNRPPVTNLYSSAIFIGWGALALCLFLEAVYKLGIGSFVGAMLGFCTMLIARFLAESGDTLQMLEAVLDTNFWLATHVVCVTLGYVASAVAGFIGIVYIVGGMFTTGMKGAGGKQVAGMMYGTVCFATLLSFVGTVLGGIWADQSWGRFWGWDPKENGAVLIVIWNALILHARWAGLVKARGMAVLSVFGNMVVAWSWFGTNQLGIGLHAYGFDNRLATGCALFWVSQLLIAGLGMMPLRFWASFGPAADKA